MDQRNTPKTEELTDPSKEKPVPRAVVLGTGMFLPALIVFLIGLAIILFFVL